MPKLFKSVWLLALLSILALGCQATRKGDQVVANQLHNEGRFKESIAIIESQYGNDPQDLAVKKLLRDSYAGAAGYSMALLLRFFKKEESEANNTATTPKTPKQILRKLLLTRNRLPQISQIQQKYLNHAIKLTDEILLAHGDIQKIPESWHGQKMSDLKILTEQHRNGALPPKEIYFEKGVLHIFRLMVKTRKLLDEIILTLRENGFTANGFFGRTPVFINSLSYMLTDIYQIFRSYQFSYQKLNDFVDKTSTVFKKIFGSPKNLGQVISVIEDPRQRLLEFLRKNQSEIIGGIDQLIIEENTESIRKRYEQESILIEKSLSEEKG